VNQNVSRGEDFGLGVGYRVGSREAPFRISPPDTSKPGRCAIHQGGIVDTSTGEWWGFSMMDANAVGRLTALSPVTWSDGWPYFGLPGNLGRTPRTWSKPRTGTWSPSRTIRAQRRLRDRSAAADLAMEPRTGRRKWSLRSGPVPSPTR
jgi:hypothetical protein